MEITVLAMVSAIGLAGVDVVFVARRTIARIYLLDAVAEVVLLVGWAIVLAGRDRAEGLLMDGGSMCRR